MVEKKITRKVISKAIPTKEKAVSAKSDLAGVKATKTAVVKSDVIEGAETAKREEVRTRRVCVFDQSKTEPSYTDIATLRRFITDRAKIVPALRSHLCSKHQRVVTRHIKYARQLALLPFTPRV